MTAMLTEEGAGRRRGEAKAWLERVSKLDGYRDSLERAAAEQARAADGLRGIDLTRPRVKAARRIDAIPDAVAAHEEASAAIAALAREACDAIADAAERIGRLEDPAESELLTRRYINRETWRRVADSMSYSESHCKAMCPGALLHVWDHMPHAERAPLHHARPPEYD